MYKRFSVLVVTLFVCGCNASKTVAPASERSESVQAPPGATPGGETSVEMVNVRIHLDPELILHIRRLTGKLVPTKKDQPPSFDDNLSYVIAVDAAEIAISTASMTHMMNTYVFGEPDAPLKNLKLSVHGSQIKQEGTIRKGPGIPFETIGDISPTPDGLLRIHPTKMTAAHLPVKGLMKLFGIDMAKLINTRNTKGITVDDNDIILDPSQALPPPKMKGRVTAVFVQGDDIVQLFGTQKPGTATKKPDSNYMAYRGGVLKFGKLAMNDTDLRLVDSHPADPFDFSPAHYKDHLVAGYSKTTESGGLIVYMPDYSAISGRTRVTKAVNTN